MAGPTPMMAQYLGIKSKHPDAILLFRMGDFYETFYEDAELVAKLLGITLTSREKKGASPIPLEGKGCWARSQTKATPCGSTTSATIRIRSDSRRDILR